MDMRVSTSAVRAVALGLLACFAGAAPATALPVAVYGDGETGFGFDPDDVSAAIGAGAAPPAAVDLSGNTPWLTITTPDSLNNATRGKNKDNPSQGESTWTLHIAPNAPVDALEDFVFVILGHDPTDPIGKYKSENVGLTIDTELPWMFVTPDGVGATGTGGGSAPVYVGFHFDDELQPGGSYEIEVDYLLAQKLKKGKNAQGEKVFFFPRYSYAVVSGVPAPEPSTLALLALGALAVGGAASRRVR
jgi:hypothetical protein